MKLRLLFSLLFLLGLNFISEARSVQAMLNYSTFWSPGNKTYLETYLAVSGNSVVYVKNNSGKYQATIEVTMIFKQSNAIKNFKKINLLSPEVDDTLNLNFNFIDQQRFVLDPGTYDFEISVSDLNQTNSSFTTTEKIGVGIALDKVALSGIELLSSVKPAKETGILTKCGYDMVPYVFDFYPEKEKEISFYAEIYLADKYIGNNEKFLVSAHIESYETSKVLQQYISGKRETAKTVNPVLMQFDISKLPSGNYNLVIEVRDKQNALIDSNKVFFQRSNPNVQFDLTELSSVVVENSFVAKYTQLDSLREMVRSVVPIATENEKEFISTYIKTAEVKTLQEFFLSFWLNRNANDPLNAYTLYNQQVKAVERMFGTRVKRGYDTDRGRVYLQYGPPNSIDDVKSEPWAYPYQIWHYYTLKNQSNKKFVFYSPALTGDDYDLLHSDALGEVFNSQWQLMLHSKLEPTNNPDQRDVTPHWGSRSNDYWNNRR